MNRCEILRITQLTTHEEGQPLLRNATISVAECETLGILVLNIRQKNALLQILAGNDAADSGVLFWEEERVPMPRFNFKKKLLCVDEHGSLIENLSIAENILFCRRDRRGNPLIHQNVINEQAQRQLDELQIPLNASTVVSRLNDFERLLVEIFRAYLLGVRIIVIDNLLSEVSIDDSVYFRELMSRLHGFGVSFIIMDTHLPTLKTYADRLLVLRSGHLLNFSDRSFECGTRILESRIAARQTGEQTTVAQNPIFSSEDLGLSTLPRSFILYRGEIVNFFDGGQGVNESIRRRIEECHTHSLLGDAQYTDFDADKHIAACLSPIENLFMSVYPFFEKRMFPGAHNISFLKKEFTEWAGDGHMLEAPNCLDLDFHERITLLLFRYRFGKTRILFCRDPKMNRDYRDHSYIMNLLRKLATTSGVAVVILSSVPYEETSYFNRIIDLSTRQTEAGAV